MIFVPLNSAFTSSVSSLDKESIQVFPNPTTNTLSIDGLESEDYTIDVFNALGEKVTSTKETIINTSNWENGMYYLHIQIERGEEIIRKVLKE